MTASPIADTPLDPPSRRPPSDAPPDDEDEVEDDEPPATFKVLQLRGGGGYQITVKFNDQEALLERSTPYTARAIRNEIIQRRLFGIDPTNYIYITNPNGWDLFNRNYFDTDHAVVICKVGEEGSYKPRPCDQKPCSGLDSEEEEHYRPQSLAVKMQKQVRGSIDSDDDLQLPSSSAAAVSSVLPLSKMRMQREDIVAIQELINTIMFPPSTRPVINGLSLTLGVARAGREAKHTCENPDVCKILNNIMEKYAPQIGMKFWTSIVINFNTVASPHKDKGNFGPSSIMVVGDYESGGEFVWTNPREAIDLKDHVMRFDGKREHESNPRVGGTYRCSIVFFCHCAYNSCKGIDRSYLENMCGFIFPPDVGAQWTSGPGAAQSSDHDVGAQWTSGPGAVIDRDDEELVAHFEEFHFGEVDEPDFVITLDFIEVKFFIGVKLNTTIGEMKDWIEDEAGDSMDSYYLRFNKRTLENRFTMEDYGITANVQLEMVPKITGGAGKVIKKTIKTKTTVTTTRADANMYENGFRHACEIHAVQQIGRASCRERV